jgi:5-methylcytosine-specific restriction endonuclease McrA
LAQRTHCVAGHEYTPETTYIDPAGKRHCTICRAAAKARDEARVKAEVCSIDGCGRSRRVGGHGWCHSHYRNWRLYGDPEAKPIRPAKYAPEERKQRQLDAAKRYRESHREQELARYREYRQVNWEQVRDAMYDWRRRNSGQWHAIVYAARLRRLELIGPDAEEVDREAILAEFGMVCHICGGVIESRADLEFDHVIPIARGGREAYDNIRPSHMVCNRRKGAKLLA